MQVTPTPLDAPLSVPPLRLPARLAILGFVFLCELLAISVCLDAGILEGRGGFADFVHDWGAWSIRLGVAVVLGSLIFAESSAKDNFRRISGTCACSPIGWPLLAAHAASMLLFVWLSSILFQNNASGMPNSLVAAWGAAGILSLVLAACAVVPPPVWIDIFLCSRDAWLYGLAAALIGCGIGKLAQNLWLPLSHWTLSLVAAMLRPFVAVLVVDPAAMSIGTPAFHVEIAPECSGYEGIGLILAFSSAWLWFFRRQWRFPQALILVPAGVALIWISNAARIAGLILIGVAGAEKIALGGFHSQAGWIAFNLVAIGICWGAMRIPSLARQPESGVAAANPTVPYLLPFVAILAAAMVSRAMTSDFEWFYGLRIASAAVALWLFRSSYRDLDWRPSWIGAAAGVLVFAVWMALDPHAHSAQPAALQHASGASRSLWITLRIVGAVITVPIAEELAFRGFLLRRLASADFESVGWRTFCWAPFLISSIAFGLMHGERWMAGAIAGAVFALAQIRRGRIGDAVVAHSVANALVAAWVLFAGDWNLW